MYCVCIVCIQALFRRRRKYVYLCYVSCYIVVLFCMYSTIHMNTCEYKYDTQTIFLPLKICENTLVLSKYNRIRTEYRTIFDREYAMI